MPEKGPESAQSVSSSTGRKEPLKTQASKLIDDQDDYGYAIPPDKDPLDPQGASVAKRRLAWVSWALLSADHTIADAAVYSPRYVAAAAGVVAGYTFWDKEMRA